MSEYRLGILLVVLSAFVFSSAGLFVKGVEAGSWAVIFWRGFFAVAFSMAYIWWRGHIRVELRQMGKSGWAVAIVGAIGTGAFVPAFKLTTIANVTLIYAAAPMIAALLAWMFVGERLTQRMFISVILAFLGVGIIVSGTLGGLHLQGDMLAVVMTLAMSIVMVIYRAFPDTPAAGPATLSSLLLMVPAIALANVFAVPIYELAILAAFGLLFAIASITLAEGARRISAAQTALLSILETPLAMLLAWLILSEVPASLSIIGGSIVFAAVIWAQRRAK